MSKKTEDQNTLEEQEIKSSKKDDLEMLDMDDIGTKKKSKKTVFDYMRYAVMTIAAVVFVVAGYNLYSIYSEYKKGEQEYQSVVDNYTTEETDDDEVKYIESYGIVVNPNFVKTNVDFESLQSINPDVKAWIQFEEVPEINYPILQHPTDVEYYLKKMWNHEDNTAGSIFLDVANSSDFMDYNTFVFGHNMKNLSMFGRLKEYKKQEFYAGKEYFWIYTPTMNYQYQIFSVHEVKVDSGFFRVFSSTGDEFTQYVADSKADARYDTGVEVNGNDKIVTLSTCTASGDTWRLLVQGKLIGFERRSTNNEEEAATEEDVTQEDVQDENEMPEGIVIQQEEIPQ